MKTWFSRFHSKIIHFQGRRNPRRWDDGPWSSCICSTHERWPLRPSLASYWYVFSFQELLQADSDGDTKTRELTIICGHQYFVLIWLWFHHPLSCVPVFCVVTLLALQIIKMTIKSSSLQLFTLSILYLFIAVTSDSHRPYFSEGGWRTYPSDLVARPGPCNIDIKARFICHNSDLSDTPESTNRF